MFATLLGALPTPPQADAGEADSARREDTAVIDAMAAQERAGLELLGDGRLRPRIRPLDEWLFTSAATSLPVKQTIRGPYSASRDDLPSAERRRRALDMAERLNAAVRDLAAAGCAFVEVDEPGAVAIGDREFERAVFVDAHRRLTDGIEGIHLSLALTGGNADTAGPATFFDLPYASYAVDLISGPDNWRLVTSAPTDRGIVCGALSPAVDGDEGPETLVWAAHYAAAGRGLERVGLANAPGLDALPWDVAIAKLARVAEAARIAALPSADAIAESIDPRAVSSRSAALGRAERAPRRARRTRPADRA